MLAMGLISAFSTPHVLLANKVLLGSFWILPIGYTISRLPFAVRMLSAAILGINTNIEEAARSLGAGVFYTYCKVIIPLLMPTILSVSALTFNGLLSEYTLSAMLYNINNKPLGIALSEAAMDSSPERTCSGSGVCRYPYDDVAGDDSYHQSSEYQTRRKETLIVILP